MCQICLIWSIFAACPFKMYGHDALQVSTKKEGFGNFLVGKAVFFLPIIKQKAGWLVGMTHTHPGQLRHRHTHQYRCRFKGCCWCGRIVVSPFLLFSAYIRSSCVAIDCTLPSLNLCGHNSTHKEPRHLCTIMVEWGNKQTVIFIIAHCER